MIEDIKPYTHIDDFLERMTYAQNQGLAYAHFMFSYFRLSAVYKNMYHPWMQQFKLFVDHEGITYRVTGASRLGDIWLTTDFDQSSGYEKRVGLDLKKQVNWRDKADFELTWSQRWWVGVKYHGILASSRERAPKKRAQLVKELDEARVGRRLSDLAIGERSYVLYELK